MPVWALTPQRIHQGALWARPDPRWTSDLPVWIQTGFQIHQLDLNVCSGSNAWFWQPHLVDDVDAIAKLLLLQERVQVVEQELQVMLPVPVGDDDGRLVPGLTVRRPVAPSSDHQRVFPLDFIQGETRREVDVDGPACGDKLICCYYRQEAARLMERRQMLRSENEPVIWMQHHGDKFPPRSDMKGTCSWTEHAVNLFTLKPTRLLRLQNEELIFDSAVWCDPFLYSLPAARLKQTGPVNFRTSSGEPIVTRNSGRIRSGSCN